MFVSFGLFIVNVNVQMNQCRQVVGIMRKSDSSCAKNNTTSLPLLFFSVEYHDTVMRYLFRFNHLLFVMFD